MKIIKRIDELRYIINYYLTNQYFITRQIEYERQIKRYGGIRVTKLLPEIKYDTANAIMSKINAIIATQTNEMKYAIELRYKQKRALDVVSDFCDVPRSTIYAKLTEFADDVLHEIICYPSLARDALLLEPLSNYKICGANDAPLAVACSERKTTDFSPWARPKS